MGMIISAGTGLLGVGFVSLMLHRCYKELSVSVNPLIQPQEDSSVQKKINVSFASVSFQSGTAIEKINHFVNGQEGVLNRSTLQTKSQQVSGNKVLSAMDSGSNLSTVLRTGSDVIDSNQTGYVSKGLVLDSSMYAALGLTTIASCLIQGPFKMMNALRALVTAKEVEDAEGVAQAEYAVAFGGFQTAGGLAILAPRVAAIAGGFGCNYKPLMQTAALTGLAVGPVFGGMFAVGGVWFGDLFMKSHRFSTEWKSTQNNTGKLEVLLNRLKVNPEILPEKEDAEKEAISYVAKLLQFEIESFIELGRPEGVSSEDWKTFIKNVKNISWETAAKKQLEKTNSEDVKSLGKKAFEGRQQEILENNLRRIIGTSALEEVKKVKAAGLFERLSSENKETQAAAQDELTALIEKVQKDADKGWYMNLLGTVMCVFLVLPAVFAYVLFDPLSMFIMNIANLIGYSLMTIFDGVNWIDDMKGEGPIGKHDKKFLLFQTLFALASISLSIVLTVMSGGTFPIALAAILGAFWLGTLLFSMYCVEKKDQRYKELHPSLEKLSAFLQNKGDLKTAKDMFLHLPEIQKEWIYQQLLKNESRPPHWLLDFSFEMKNGEQATAAFIGKAFFDEYLTCEGEIKTLEKMDEMEKQRYYEKIYEDMCIQARESLLATVEKTEELLKAIQQASKKESGWGTAFKANKDLINTALPTAS